MNKADIDLLTIEGRLMKKELTEWGQDEAAKRGEPKGWSPEFMIFLRENQDRYGELPNLGFMFRMWDAWRAGRADLTKEEGQ